MANGYCNGCGCVFDMQYPSCPRCGRCPECGTKVTGTACCPSCGHPQDGAAVAELERKLNPSLPANRRWIESLETSWRIEKLVTRLHWGTLFCLLLPFHILTLLMWMTLFDQVGWKRGAESAAFFTTFSLWWYGLRQLGRGRWQWLLQPAAREKSGADNA